MKKFILPFICFPLFSLSSLAFADDYNSDSTNWGIQPQKQQASSNGEAAEATWNREQDLYVYDNYGSEDSPAFLDRGNINPDESEYNYGTFDGVD